MVARVTSQTLKNGANADFSGKFADNGDGILCPVVAPLPSILSTATFTPGSGAYAAGQAICATGSPGGGILTFSGLPPLTPCMFEHITAFMPMTATTAISTVAYVLYNSAPSTTFADTVIPTFNAADSAKLSRIVAASSGFAQPTTGTLAEWIGTALPTFRFTPDASGNVYCAILASAVNTWNTPGVMTLNLSYQL